MLHLFFKMSHWILLVFLLSASLFSGCPSGTGANSSNDGGDGAASGEEAGLVSWIDTHAHPMSGISEDGITSCSTADCLAGTIELMDAQGVLQAIFIPPPSPSHTEDTEDEVLASVQVDPERFVYGGGGVDLNGYIQRADRLEEDGMSDQAHAGMIEDSKEAMRANAEELITDGAMVFGETAALHLSAYEEHAFEEVAPDHELFLYLADLAAEFGVPIDLHMSAVAEDMETPAYFAQASSRNPATLEENITGFENLLEHNPNAKIVWAHVGWDNTGDLTVSLLRQLLSDHPNLYAQLRIITIAHLLDPPVIDADNAPIDENGTIHSAWLELIEDFPDRFVMGSDAFVLEEHDEDNFEEQQEFLQQLPEDLANKVGSENAKAIYGLE